MVVRVGCAPKLLSSFSAVSLKGYIEGGQQGLICRREALYKSSCRAGKVDGLGEIIHVLRIFFFFP